MIQNKIEKIHFLIHPGYWNMYAQQDLPDDFEPKPKEVLPKSEQLLEKYVEHAKSLKENEILFIFIPTDLENFNKNHFRKDDFLAQKINEIRQILGRRVISVTDPEYDVPSEGSASFAKIKAIAEARGFILDKNVKTEAFGEILGECVESGAENLNEKGDFNKKTKIRTDLTDGPLEIRDPYDLKSHKKEMLEQFKRIEY